MSDYEPSAAGAPERFEVAWPQAYEIPRWVPPLGESVPEPAGGDSVTACRGLRPLTFDLVVPPAGTGSAEVT
jgi:hypothetical protein